MVLKLGHFGK